MKAKKIQEAILLFLLLQIAGFTHSLPLFTDSRWIVDENGKRMKLTCVNWATHLQPMVAEGLEKKPVGYIASQIAATGFNCVRFTWATYMYTRPLYRDRLVSQSLDDYGLADAKAGIAENNPRFLNMTVVGAHRAVVDELAKNGLMVVLDNHISLPTWCCGDEDGNGFFGDHHFDPQEWVQGLTTVASAYKSNPGVVAMSIRNELRGDRQNADDWFNYVQQGGDAIHGENPDLLVIISGLSYAKDLSFLKNRRIKDNFDNKLVFEVHWYAFGISSNEWAGRTNQICAREAQRSFDNYFYLMTGDNPFPLFLSEFGVDQRGNNVADNRYISCLMAMVAEYDLDWALWTFQGSYMLRQGKTNAEEVYGVMNLNWDCPRNSSFLNRLQYLRQTNQQASENPSAYWYTLFHPQSGRCVQCGQSGIILGSCKSATRWRQYLDNGAVMLASSEQCLVVVGDGAAVNISSDCSSGWSLWKSVSASGLQLAAKSRDGQYLCLEMNAPDAMVVAQKCLCVDNNLQDVPSCDDNPQVQWFKFAPTNVMNEESA